MARNTICLVFIMLLFETSHAQEPLKVYEVDPITVTATRLDQKYAATRSVSVLTREEIMRLPAQSVTQLMNYALGVSMNTRGTAGVQSDPSIRGAGFEQVLFLLDGVRMNDPQTGHHNTNLPITIQDIERIEVLRGQGSALYGPDAFGGVINIITKRSSDKQVNVDISGGAYKTFTMGSSLSIPTTIGIHRISLESLVSDGYEDFNRQYRIRTAHWRSDFNGSKHRLSLSSGYVEKDFGAQLFYTTTGEEYEETRSFYTHLKTVSAVSSSLTTTLSLHFKQHKDMWTFFFDDPSFFTANHTTRRYTGEWTGRFATERFGSFTLGLEGNHETIESTSLGDHDNDRLAVFGEYGHSFIDDFLVNAGIRVDNHSVWGTEFNPSLGIGFIANPRLFLKASVGRSFRAPTFIELYSPIGSFNQGDPTLTPERGINFDLGAEYSLRTTVKGTTTYYRRDQDNTIDWMFVPGDPVLMTRDHFEAFTFVDVVSQGIEQEVSITPNGTFSMNLSYTYLHQNVDKNAVDSRYLFIYPSHHLSISPRFKISAQLEFLTTINWKERSYRAPKGINNSWVVDARVRYVFQNFTFTLDGLNLMDEAYEEIRNVPMPGRAVYGGVHYTY